MAMLDSLGIAIAAVDQFNNQIHYVDDLMARQPGFTIGQRKDEQRFYFMNVRNRLQRWDADIIAQAGIDSTNRLIVQFYDEPLTVKLRQLEEESVLRDGKELSDIEQTVYGVRQVGGHYEFCVLAIDYRDRD